MDGFSERPPARPLVGWRLTHRGARERAADQSIDCSQSGAELNYDDDDEAARSQGKIILLSCRFGSAWLEVGLVWRKKNTMFVSAQWSQEFARRRLVASEDGLLLCVWWEPRPCELATKRLSQAYLDWSARQTSGLPECQTAAATKRPRRIGGRAGH